MFQFPRFASTPYVFRCWWLHLKVGFPHSDIVGSLCVCPLPDAFRRLLRPSSPPTAKASTKCAYLLDHITSKYLKTLKTHVYLSLVLHSSLKLITESHYWNSPPKFIAEHASSLDTHDVLLNCFALVINLLLQSRYSFYFDFKTLIRKPW